MTTTPLDVDALYAQVSDAGTSAWRIPQRRESGGLVSRAAAHQYRVVFSLLNKVLGDTPRRVLDWGCGAATFSAALAFAGHHVWGTDFAVPPMADYVTEQSDGRFTYVRSQDPTVLPFDDGAFDVVLSNGCLEHVAETGGSDVASMAEVARVLAPGGAFVCAHLPNEGSYIEAVARALRGPVRTYLHYPLYAHTDLYSRERVDALAATCGLGVSDFQAYGALPRNPLSLLPRSVTDAAWFVDAFDRLDDRLGALVPQYCQNFAWIGHKAERTR